MRRCVKMLKRGRCARRAVYVCAVWGYSSKLRYCGHCINKHKEYCRMGAVSRMTRPTKTPAKKEE